MGSVDEEEVTVLIEKILREGLVPLEGLPMVMAEGGRVINRKGRMIIVSAHGQGLIEQLVDELRADQTVARSLSASDVDAEVVSAVFAAIEDRASVRNQARRLINQLSIGQEEWTVVWPVMGLDMAPGEKLDIAGFSIGPLSATDLQAVWADVEDYASKAILADDPTPGSGADHVRGFTQQALESSGCWAIGKVLARQDSIQMIVNEELSVAFDILRSFALYVGIDPDDTYVGLPHSNDVSSALVYVPGGTFVWPNARMDTRQSYVLSKDRVEHLRNFDLFQRACEIVRKGTLTRMEEQTQLAMLQFGLSSRLERSGARLVNYLTVLETVLGGEKGAPKGTTIGRRLSLFFAPGDRAKVRQNLEELYALRQRHAHHGQTSLRGRVVISNDDIGLAQFYAYFAILFGLRATTEFTDLKKSHKEFIAAVDAESSDSGRFVL